ncbi:uncharacterized protein LOC123308797 [Coccinella septempunctata]|uniref:uncharacterized protein LOC123308797 n=1 Tax=Coccinella septempunctata TaxID=41139 RepID=UPI001D0697DF|nr:uncharacterized protein LOC123308797 [Coccinella septempunctata]
MDQLSTSKVDNYMESTNEGRVSTAFNDSMNQPSTSKVDSYLQSRNEEIDNRSNDDGMLEPDAVLKKLKERKVLSREHYKIQNTEQFKSVVYFLYACVINRTFGITACTFQNIFELILNHITVIITVLYFFL